MSQQVFAIFRCVTPLVEPLSLDEAYLDVTENAWGETLGMNVARQTESEIRNGHRTDGVRWRRAEQVPRQDRLGLAKARWADGDRARAGRAVSASASGGCALGRGARHGAKAARPRHRKAGRCAHRPTPTAARSVGSLADWLQRLARGIDDRPVISERETKSSGSENTFERDLTNLDEIRQEVADMARSSASWLARRELFARTVMIKVRYNDFTTITRSHTETPTRDEASIVTRAIALLERTEAGRRPVRLLGVSVHNLCDVLTPATYPRAGPSRDSVRRLSGNSTKNEGFSLRGDSPRGLKPPRYAL